MIKKLRDIAVDYDDLSKMESVKNKLFSLLLEVYDRVDVEIAKELKYYESRFIPTHEAKDRVISKYHPKILNDERETELVVNFREICSSEGIPNNGHALIDYLATELTPFMSVAYTEYEIDSSNEYVKRLIEPLMAYEIIRRLNILDDLEQEHPQQEDNILNRTRKTIEDEFLYKGEIDWKFAFKQEKDFNEFVTLLTLFFTGEKYKLTDTISLKAGSKTRLARILRNIYRELSEDKMRSNEKFFSIVGILSPYKNDPNLYETLTK